MPDNAPIGYYVYVASFRVSFTKGEVSRDYTLKIKTSSTGSDSNNFESLDSYDNA